MKDKRSGEELSAFFVGLLYFIVQWIWQMQNSKQGGGMLTAYILMLAVAVSGMLSSHTRLIHGHFPDLRMRLANLLLFLPFAVIAVVTYPHAMEQALVGPPPATLPWSTGTPLMAAVGIAVGFIPYIVGSLISRFGPVSDKEA